MFTHIPGLRVVMPSNALDACGLLRTAIRCDDPVLFLEHKRLYREPYNRSPHPGPDYTIPFGKAQSREAGHEPDHRDLRRAGAEVAAGGAADGAAQSGRTVEVIDLRSLSPYDWEAIRTSVEKTSRVMVAHEDALQLGLRRGDRRAHRRGVVRVARRAGGPRRRARHLGRLPSRISRTRSCRRWRTLVAAAEKTLGY